jgi:hypothetical protein
MMGVATASGEYVDICSSEWISRLRVALAGHLVRFGTEDLDASVLQMTAPRGLTQLASRVVFSEGIAGIYYRSKYGHDVENWALFEPFQIAVKDPHSVRVDDPDLQHALQCNDSVFPPRPKAISRKLSSAWPEATVIGSRVATDVLSATI